MVINMLLRRQNIAAWIQEQAARLSKGQKLLNQLCFRRKMDQDSDPEIAALKGVTSLGCPFQGSSVADPLAMASHGHSGSGHHLCPPQEGPFCSTGLIMATPVAGWGRPVVGTHEPPVHLEQDTTASRSMLPQCSPP